MAILCNRASMAFQNSAFCTCVCLQFQLGKKHKVSSLTLYNTVECCRILYLVGGFNPSEKYDFVSWDDDIPNMMGKS